MKEKRIVNISLNLVPLSDGSSWSYYKLYKEGVSPTGLLGATPLVLKVILYLQKDQIYLPEDTQHLQKDQSYLPEDTQHLQKDQSYLPEDTKKPSEILKYLWKAEKDN